MLLESAGQTALVAISRRGDCGSVLVARYNDLAVSVLIAKCTSITAEQTIHAVFEEAGIPQVEGTVPHWKEKRSLKYTLPTDPSKAARLIGQVFRAGYGLSDLSSVDIWYWPQTTSLRH